ncbi:hypothetical protein HZB04_02900 [Candidatus Wolfebacteria bacterium]|nr:hypothetical protein [Candidatus Wolfebacteria bacterium]
MKKIQLQDLIKTKHKEVLFKQKGNAKMILAYHTYGNGVCFGGIRLLPFNAGEKAVKDVLRLSEAMTYKLAFINSPYGDCKAVVFEPSNGKTINFLHNIGALIEEEKGRFISAIDFDFEPDDAKIIRESTKYILAIKDSKFGQSGTTTAYGVLEGIKTSLNEMYGSDLIAGHSFAIQGLGSVGVILADKLIKFSGKVYVSDLDINQDTIPKLKCKIIAGGANCQLEDEFEDDKKLRELRILIAPDYVINAGGVMQGIEELIGGSLKNAMAKLPLISKNLKQIYAKSKQENRGTYAIAKEMAILKFNDKIKNK